MVNFLAWIGAITLGLLAVVLLAIGYVIGMSKKENDDPDFTRLEK